MDLYWQLPKKLPKKIQENFPEINPIVLSILYNRGLDSQEKIDEFFLPDYSQDIHNPFLFKDMKKSVKRIKQARDKKEKVLIYGDFDADGVTSTVLLLKAFKKFGLKKIDFYLPDREKDGYGLNKKVIENFQKKGVSLIVTCDCGISNVEEVDLAKKLGIDVIITDHHFEGPKRPAAFSIINPKLKGESYPYFDLAGVGVSFKLAQALLSEDKPKNEAFLKWLLDLVAIGTIADRMPLLGENRTLVKYGLLVLNKTSNLGLRALIKKANLNLNSIESDDVGYRIGPRLNAAGRINHASDSLFLLLAKDKEEADFFAEKIEKMNQQRQSLVDKIFLEIEKDFKEKLDKKFIFIFKESLPSGVMGLVANKLVDKYGRPAVLISQKQEHLKGSGRAPKPFDLLASLEKFRNYFSSLGGHKQAAGFELKDKKYLSLLEKGLIKEANKFKKEKFVPKIKIDALLKLDDITWDLYEEISRFAPFGKDNEIIKFLVKNVQLTNLETVGQNGQHYRLVFENRKKMIYFSFDKSKDLKVGNFFDVVFTLGVNQWNGQQELELKLLDIRPSLYK